MTGVVKTTSPISRRRTRRIFKLASAFDRGLVDQHHRDVVLDRIDPAALFALQAGAVLDDMHGRFALRTHENLEECRINSHWGDCTRWPKAGRPGGEAEIESRQTP